jgi:acetoin utilization protein AcuB
MRDLKIGALPVVNQDRLVGLITESDIFRAFVEIFSRSARGARITLQVTRDEDVLPVIVGMANRHGLQVISFFSLQKHEHPVCVVQVAGKDIDAMIEEVWASHHRVISVLRLS